MLCDCSQRCRRDAESLLHTAEIEKSDVEMPSRGAVTLDFVSPTKHQPLRFAVFAVRTGHRTSPVVFLREKPDTKNLWSECGLRPRLDSALPSVQPDGRAFLFTTLLLRLCHRFSSSGHSR